MTNNLAVHILQSKGIFFGNSSSVEERTGDEHGELLTLAHFPAFLFRIFASDLRATWVLAEPSNLYVFNSVN